MRIEFKDVSFKYYNSANYVFEHLSFIVEDSSMLAILGHNGSGKSTIAKLIVGLLTPTSGSIFIDDIELNESSVDELRKKMGIIFQNPDNQFVGVTVKDDIAFGLENHLVERKEMIELIHEGINNIICMQPFGCLPNHVTGKGAIKALRKKYPQSNIVAVDYDPGASEVNQLNRIKLMLSTAFKNLDKE